MRALADTEAPESLRLASVVAGLKGTGWCHRDCHSGFGVRLSGANFPVSLYDFVTGLPVHLPASTYRLCDLGPVASSLRAFVSLWVECGQ